MFLTTSRCVSLDRQVTKFYVYIAFSILLRIPVCIISFDSHTGAVKADAILCFTDVGIDA